MTVSEPVPTAPHTRLTSRTGTAAWKAVNSADIAVFEKNIFDCADDRSGMFDMKVLMTMVGGKIVYGK